MQVAQGVLGIAAILGFAWMVSEDRRAFPWRTVIAGMLLQLLIAAVLLKVPQAKGVFLALNEALMSLEQATAAGTTFVFGFLGGGELPYAETAPGRSFVLAFRALPLVLVVSALSSLLFHWRVLPAIVRAISRVLQRVMGVGGAVGLSAAADVFVGMIEAPLLIRPYLQVMTRGELFSVMTCGMATIAGTVMFLYASFLARTMPDAMGHIITASLVSTPGAILLAAVMVPAGERVTTGELTPPQPASSGVDAITKGAIAGVELLINIVAMLVVFVALVHLANLVLGLLPPWAGAPVTLQRTLGVLMAPVMWLIGIPWQEAGAAGALMGTKTILNEFIAYLDMAALPEGTLGARSQTIMLYALCGFANFGSLGILIGGLGTMAPDRREEIVQLGLRSVLSGTLATLLTAAIVGLLI
ncbi:MAG: putative nucleoside permease NupX [Gammaproteobacteria bacterium]|nr:putative nucleoside permease NupX [Gammaproteobacteria bacterium]